MTFLIGTLAVVLLLALVNWVACFFGCDVAGLLSEPAPSEPHGHERASSASGAGAHESH